MTVLEEQVERLKLLHTTAVSALGVANTNLVFLRNQRIAAKAEVERLGIEIEQLTETNADLRLHHHDAEEAFRLYGDREAEVERLRAIMDACVSCLDTALQSLDRLSTGNLAHGKARLRMQIVSLKNALKVKP